MPHVYEEVMNIPQKKKLNFSGEVEVGVICVAEVKGKVAKVGGSADAEIVQTPRPGNTQVLN